MPTVVSKYGGAGKIKKYLKSSSPATEVPSPARKKRPASPPHEEVLADNSDIAVSVWRVNRVSLRVLLTRLCSMVAASQANTLRS